MSLPTDVNAHAEGADRNTALIQRTVQRLAQLQARRALADMRKATAARARARRNDARRHQELGAAIDGAGFADWPPADIMGLLLVGRDHFGEADTARKLMRERAALATQAVPQR